MKPLLEYNLNGLSKLAADYAPAFAQVSRAKMTEALMLLESVIKPKTPYGAGPIHLRNATQTRIDVTGSTVTGVLGNPLEHGEPVESGTKPHFPPLDPLQFWVENKLGYSGKEARSIAYAIAVKISQKGTEGVHMFEKGFEENKTAVIAILNEIKTEMAARLSL